MKFIDVIKLIKKYAFIKSKYPLILTLENWCKNKTASSQIYNILNETLET